MLKSMRIQSGHAVRSSFRRWQSAVIVLAFLALPTRSAWAGDPARDFVVSCSYGVLAGSLVGAAALAFTDRPGDSLNMVARGASIGLYAGILLGLYVATGQDLPDEDAALLPDGRAQYAPPRVRGGRLATLPRAMLVPVLGARGLEGAQLSYSVLSF